MRLIKGVLIGVFVATAFSVLAQPPVTITPALYINGSGVARGGGTFPGNLFVTGAGSGFGVGSISMYNTAPVATTFCTSPSIPANNGTFVFTVNVGTGCASSTGTLTMPTAGTGWVADCHNVTAPASNVVEQTGGSTTTITLTNYVRTTGVAGNWTDSNVLRCSAVAY